jgi:peptidoglycan/xylan/chitin deacetylase (PgdA/CDA1 family)
MLYPVKIPWLIKKWVYPNYTWSMPAIEKRIYLSFDDGPHPQATPFVLDTLKQYNAKASFFCIGKNVQTFPEIYKRILLEGHAVGNHTHNHLNGWKTNDAGYFDNIKQAAQYIDSGMFRPPYGRITRFQAKHIQQKLGLQIIMWSVLSGDFDINISPTKCLQNVKRNAENGSIIVFHDSEKALERMRYALPELLNYFGNRGYEFHKLDRG